jgi:hypothetical protein
MTAPSSAIILQFLQDNTPVRHKIMGTYKLLNYNKKLNRHKPYTTRIQHQTKLTVYHVKGTKQQN